MNLNENFTQKQSSKTSKWQLLGVVGVAAVAFLAGQNNTSNQVVSGNGTQQLFQDQDAVELYMEDALDQQALLMTDDATSLLRRSIKSSKVDKYVDDNFRRVDRVTIEKFEGIGKDRAERWCKRTLDFIGKRHKYDQQSFEHAWF